MSIKSVFLLAFLGMSGVVYAQATVESVSGLVTATSGDQLLNVTSGMKLPEGSQVQVTTGGTLVVTFPNGCRASLGSGQTMVLTQTQCEVLAKAPKAAPGLFASLPTSAKLGLGLLSVGALSAATQGNAAPLPATTTLPVSGS